LDLLELQEFKVQQALKVRKVLKDQQVHKAFKAYKVYRVIKVFKDRLVLLDLQGLPERLVLKVLLAPRVLQV